jgi:DNA-binding response OmpR family regulator
MKILAIDGNTSITTMLEQVLNSCGFEFLFTNGGNEGLKMMQEQKFDIVLLDPDMPDFSGVDIIGILSRENLLYKQKIIMFTAMPMTDSEIQQFLMRGIHYFIRKPVDVDYLIERLNEIGSC